MSESACTAKTCNPGGLMCLDFDTCHRVKIYGAVLEVPGEPEPQPAPVWQVFGFGLLIGLVVGFLAGKYGQALERGLWG